MNELSKQELVALLLAVGLATGYLTRNEITMIQVEQMLDMNKEKLTNLYLRLNDQLALALGTVTDKTVNEVLE